MEGVALLRRAEQVDTMTEAATPLPAAKAFGEDEASVLLGYLAYHRAVLTRRAEASATSTLVVPLAPQAHSPSLAAFGT